MIKVTKFGGSSVANSAQFKKVKHIIDSDNTRKFIITSACGKESNEDYKITDLLYLCDAHIRYGVDYHSIFSLIENKYNKIKQDLSLSIDLDKEFSIIKSQMDSGNISQDYLVSRGEYLTALLLAEYLNADFIDAKDIICFKYDGSIDLDKTKEALLPRIGTKKIVIPGFYGKLSNGVIKVMPRGGSDITGSIIANVVDADIYENWTDVNGFLVTSPKIIDNPAQIPYITYSELRGMSYMGANVLHDDAVFPVKSKNIPINVRNTNDPDNPGTLIKEDYSDMDAKNPPAAVTGITGRKNYTSITLTKSHSSAEVGFMRKVLEVFEEYHISIESVPNTVDTISIIVLKEAIEPYLYEIVNKLQTQFEPEDITVDEDLALVAVVGRGMKAVPGASGSFLSEFGHNNINIKVICQSADELSITVGVKNQDFEKAIQCIYHKFISTQEDSL